MSGPPHSVSPPAVLDGGFGCSPAATSTTVLLVEDNVVNQKVFDAMMRSLGYDMDVASNGLEALDALDRRHYVVVFMDCQMPVMDGYRATEKIREREGRDRRTCVIAVTASASAADRARCLAAGMDDYMTKPIKAEDLATKLDYWVHGVGVPPELVPREPAQT